MAAALALIRSMRNATSSSELRVASLTEVSVAVRAWIVATSVRGASTGAGAAGRSSSARSDIHAGGAQPVRGGTGGSGARAGAGVDASTGAPRFGAEPSTAVTRGDAGTSKRPDVADSTWMGSERGAASTRGSNDAGAGAGAAAATRGVAAGAASLGAGRWLGSSHSPQYRHFTAASWIDSAQKGQAFTTDRP
jgi:hypothetical protein